MFHIESFVEIKKQHIGYIPTERELEIKKLFLHGKSMAEIGKINSISRERVRWLLKNRFNLTSEDGGLTIQSYVVSLEKQIKIKTKRTIRIERALSCTASRAKGAQRGVNGLRLGAVLLEPRVRVF